jgi:protein TonB
MDHEVFTNTGKQAGVSNSSNTVAVSLDDIIFENRNKAYGAYVLRKNYHSRLFISAIIAMSTTLLMFLGMPGKNITPPVDSDKDTLDSVYKFKEIIYPAEKKELVIPMPADAATKKSGANLPQVIAPDDSSPADTTTATGNADGKSDDGEQKKGNDGNAGNAKDTASNETAAVDTLSYAPDEMPEFPGGFDALTRFMEKHLEYPDRARQVDKEGKVVVYFVVGKNGEIRDISIAKSLGFGCDEEAMRVVKKMPKWKPGKAHGNAVSVRFYLPVNFKLM